MKLKFFTFIALVALITANSRMAFAQGSLPPSWSLSRQASSMLPAEGTVAGGNLTGEQAPALTVGSITNGNFDLGPGVGWGQSSSNGFPLIEPKANLPMTPHSGDYATWLGGGDYETSYIVQYGIPITKPATILHLWYIIGSQEMTCGNDFGYITINTVDKVFTWDLCDANDRADWVEMTLDLRAYNGQTVNLAVVAVTNSSLNSNLFIDDISLGGAFVDVPNTHTYSQDIEILYANGLTGGCSTSPMKFCPDQIMDRAQASVFMIRGVYGSAYLPNPTANLFQDSWTPGAWAQPWVEAMRETGLTTGCQLTPWMYCPWKQLPREQVVIFGLKMKYGNGYLPPAATGTVFADMTDPNYYATSWAEQAYADGLITSCGTLNGKPKFCPATLVTRGMGAYIIVRAKNLTMP